MLSAMPSSRPTIAGDAPSTAVTNNGTIGYSISEEMSVRRLTMPRTMTFLISRFLMSQC